MSSVYAINFFGPRTDPCGTPGHDSMTVDDWPLAVRYDWNQESAEPVTQKHWWRI